MLVEAEPIRSDRCAEAARVEGVDPIGTAVCARGFLLVEWPRPWPRDAALVPELAGVVAELAHLAGGGDLQRLQLVEAPAPRTDGKLRVIHYQRSALRFTGFVRRELACTRDEVPAACHWFLRDGADASTPSDDVARDVLVCTHGSRDVCCGSAGTALHTRLAATYGPDSGITVWRTSHLGGHRFAPTMATLPDGQYWAHLDVDLATGIIDRSVDVAAVAGCYRGTAGFATPAVQAVEREAFVRHGWAWLDAARDASFTEIGPSTAVCVSYEHPQLGMGTVRGTVDRTGSVSIPPCRSTDGKPTIDHRLVVSDVRCAPAPGRST